MENEEMNSDEELIEYDIDEEKQNAYLLLRLGRAMRRLIQSVYCEYGLLLNDESREVYQDLREEIICVSDAMDDDCIRHYDLYLGVHVESTFSEELDDIDRGENDLGEKAQDFIDGLLAYEELIIAFTGNVIFEIDSFRQETLDRAEKVIKSNNEEMAMYIGSMKKDTEQTVFSLAINTIAADLDFSYIEQAQLKELLVDYLKEAVTAYKHELFRTTVILSRSIIEALLVYSLECLGDDAKIDYAGKYKGKLESWQCSEKARNIDKWDMYDLVEIASENNMFQTRNIEKHCNEINYYRNAIHIYRNLSSPTKIDFRIANLSLVVLSSVHNDLKLWFDNQKNREVY